MIGFGLMVLSAILIGGLYPALVQKFQVQPNEQAKEAPYVEKNLAATRDAYGIEGTQVAEYPGKSETKDKTKLRDDADAAASVRIMDPNIISPTFQQLQQMRNYYAFPTNLDVDRYAKDGKDQDTVIGLRELNLAGIPKKNWINNHFRYTHGYGVVAAKGTQVDSEDARSSPSPTCRPRATSESTSSGSTTARRPPPTRSSAVPRRRSTTRTTPGRRPSATRATAASTCPTRSTGRRTRPRSASRRSSTPARSATVRGSSTTARPRSASRRSPPG